MRVSNGFLDWCISLCSMLSLIDLACATFSPRRAIGLLCVVVHAANTSVKQKKVIAGTPEQFGILHLGKRWIRGILHDVPVKAFGNFHHRAKIPLQTKLTFALPTFVWICQEDDHHCSAHQEKRCKNMTVNRN